MLEGRQFPMFKIVQRPLLPVSGSWIDAAPFVGIMLLLGAAAYFAYYYKGQRREIARRLVQAGGAFFLVIFLHRCMCVLRGGVFGLQTLGRNNLIAFGDAVMMVALAAATVALGRVFCGWVCPLGLVQELLSKPGKMRLGMKSQKWSTIIGYLILGGIVVLLVWLAYLVRPANQFFVENVAAVWALGLLVVMFWAVPRRRRKDDPLRTVKYFSAAGYVVLSGVGVFVTSPWCVLYGDELDYSSVVSLLGVLLATMVIPLAWCRYLCFLGGGLALLTHFSPYKIRNQRQCRKCGQCEQLCPTGALAPGRIDHSSCVYCGLCIEHCGFEWEKGKQ